MSYIDGFLLAVPAESKAGYRKMADTTSAVIKEHGASRVIEGWGDDVPEGKVTDFRMAVKAAEGEVVVFGWIEWPSKAVRDEGMKNVMEDPRMQIMRELPIDGQRMIFGGFEVLLDV
ncbi:DUF1428 domain-containing protein [Marinivivus vitaminiproducens]|uniref:DUF1428 domain-containing protein n=1 Tax=Marinivivus vitaminiproducens TaxID=3035935 RepID=UPI0027A7B290|nr:DUF1428 domain-containing protein [Geminicoccaceae bacterium SCSIO 64248]